MKTKSRSMKKRILTVAVSVLMLIMAMMFSGCSQEKSEDEILADLPEEVTFLEIGGEPISLEVDSLEIERRRTEDGTDDVYSVIDLSSESFAVTRYLHLSYVEYNGNEWYLEYTEPYQEETVTVLDVPQEIYDWSLELMDQRSILYGDLASYIESYNATVVNNEIHCEFYINKMEGIMHTSGPVTMEYYISQEDNEYIWRIRSDFENLKTSWDVSGSWSGSFEGSSCYAVNLDLVSLDSENVDCTWEYSRESFYGDVVTLSGNGYDCAGIEEEKDSIKFTIQYGNALSNYIHITFYEDGTAAAKIGLVPTIYLEREW